ncbi:hypothetical protein DDD63_10245 [Actinobaculum sp. 313]|nr:hypothetical protein DDD63_10245 [Actinobaculum sp. 313]
MSVHCVESVSGHCGNFSGRCNTLEGMALLSVLSAPSTFLAGVLSSQSALSSLARQVTSTPSPSPDATPADDSTTVAETAVEATVDVLGVVLRIGIGIVVGLLISFLLQGVIKFIVRRHEFLRGSARKAVQPLQLVLGTLGAWVGMVIAVPVAANQEQPQWREYAQHSFLILLIFAGTWLIVSIVDGAEQTIVKQVKAAGESRYRKVQTQAQILHRVIVVVIWVFGLAGILMTFPSARTAGASVFASAGLVSVVAGIAAQATLGNVFAGLQLAFSDSIRVGDIVIWQSEYSTVEEITLTYVVLKVWDGRRLIVPSSLMTTETFENWTRRTPAMLGYVHFQLDWQAPIPQMRVELERILQSTDLWDGNTGILQVRDADSELLQVSALLSAKNSSTLTDLRYYVREQMVRWIQENAPSAMPHMRYYAGTDVPDMVAPDEVPFPEVKARAEGQAEDSSQQEVRSGRVQARLPQRGDDTTPEAAFAGDGTSGPAPTAADLTETRVLSVEEIGLVGPARVPAGQREIGPTETMVAPGHESSIFTGSVAAEKRGQEFAGPGDEAMREREAAAERRHRRDDETEERHRDDRQRTSSPAGTTAERAAIEADSGREDLSETENENRSTMKQPLGNPAQDTGD